MKTHYDPKDGLDASGEWVWHFRMEARNLSSVAQLRKLIAEAFTQKHWRSYATGIGRDEWRDCEFDYFLIASDIAYRDMSELFTWRDHGRELAEMVKETDPAKRRTLKEASATWRSPTTESLAQHAARLGWTSPTGLSVRAPAEAWSKVSKRARAYVSHDGMTLEKLARQQRQRQIKTRRADLDREVEKLVTRLDEPAVRYVVDRLRERLAKMGRPKSDRQQWARDIATFKGDAKALAKHWGLKQAATYKRLILLKSRLKWNKRAS